MKKIEREPYRYLANLVGYGLCNFCKYADWSGSSCCDSELECTHPLDIINGYYDEEQPDNVWAGDDCWGYRHNTDLQKCGAIVGIMLEGNMPHTNRRGELVAIIPSEADKRELMMA